jgi:hypothetical protein
MKGMSEEQLCKQIFSVLENDPSGMVGGGQHVLDVVGWMSSTSACAGS